MIAIFTYQQFSVWMDLKVLQLWVPYKCPKRTVGF